VTSYVLTAAHCCDGSLGYFDVILGSQAQSQTESNEFKTGKRSKEKIMAFILIRK
jgi:secreted trypsin-like serine protease